MGFECEVEPQELRKHVSAVIQGLSAPLASVMEISLVNKMRSEPFTHRVGCMACTLSPMSHTLGLPSLASPEAWQRLRQLESGLVAAWNLITIGSAVVGSSLPMLNMCLLVVVVQVSENFGLWKIFLQLGSPVFDVGKNYLIFVWNF